MSNVSSAQIKELILLQSIAPYLTIITAIVAAYFAFRNQLRLKAFELLYERRQSVLNDVEKYLGVLYTLIRVEQIANNESVHKFASEHFHESHILFHKVKGAQFGELVDGMADAFLSVANEAITPNGSMSEEMFRDIVSRQANTLSALYGFAHRQITVELNEMAFSWIKRFVTKRNEKTKK